MSHQLKRGTSTVTAQWLPTCAWILKPSSCWREEMMPAVTILLIWTFSLKQEVETVDGVDAEVATQMLRLLFAVFLAGFMWWLGYQGCSTGDKIITCCSPKLGAKSRVWALLYTFDKQLSWLQPQHRIYNISKTETNMWYLKLLHWTVCTFTCVYKDAV